VTTITTPAGVSGRYSCSGAGERAARRQPGVDADEPALQCCSPPGALLRFSRERRLGPLLGPVLAYMGFSLYAIAPAALTSTFVTSVAGVLAYQALELAKGDDAIAPEWPLGSSMSVGGLCGSYLGARLQGRVPEAALRRLLGVVCLVFAIRYALQGAGVA
jgi:hypothetical protein